MDCVREVDLVSLAPTAGVLRCFIVEFFDCADDNEGCKCCRRSSLRLFNWAIRKAVLAGVVAEEDDCISDETA